MNLNHLNHFNIKFSNLQYVAQLKEGHIGFGVLTSVVMKRDIFVAYPSTLKIKVTCSSEKSVDFQRTTRRYILEGRTIQKNISFNKYQLCPHRYTDQGGDEL
jgi:hypothetical protein